MVKFDDPLTMANEIVKDLPTRFIATIKKGDLATTAELHNDLYFLSLAVGQLASERINKSRDLADVSK